MASQPRKSSLREIDRANEEIRFVVGESSLGSILVASSVKGVVSILISEDPVRLLADVQSRFPRAHFVPGGQGDQTLLLRVVDFVEEPTPDLDVPLDIRGSAFQRRVWQAVRDIPMGQTATYTEVADRIGAPRAARAVGNACSTNSLAIAVPCHRVLRRNGSVSGGDFWGEERRRVLLNREAEAVSKKRPKSKGAKGC
jgi:AraC family transcriptional regulator of adaptative response/methylated-DNA-[protein]-cysteine methyltransferase